MLTRRSTLLHTSKVEATLIQTASFVIVRFPALAAAGGSLFGRTADGFIEGPVYVAGEVEVGREDGFGVELGAVEAGFEGGGGGRLRGGGTRGH